MPIPNKIIVNAMMYPCPWKLPFIIVYIFVVSTQKRTGDPRKTGTAYALIAEANTSRKVERRAGMTIGSVIFRMILARLAFKIVAASSRFASILRRIPPMRM